LNIFVFKKHDIKSNLSNFGQDFLFLPSFLAVVDQNRSTFIPVLKIPMFRNLWFSGDGSPALITLYQPTGDYLKNAGSPCRMIFLGHPDSNPTGCLTTLDTWKIWLSARPFINMNWTSEYFLRARFYKGPVT
jgi:hypothetical protein